jgi:hypothetical protein
MKKNSLKNDDDELEYIQSPILDGATKFDKIFAYRLFKTNFQMEILTSSLL